MSISSIRLSLRNDLIQAARSSTLGWAPAFPFHSLQLFQYYSKVHMVTISVNQFHQAVTHLYSHSVLGKYFIRRPGKPILFNPLWQLVDLDAALRLPNLTFCTHSLWDFHGAGKLKTPI